LASVDLTFCRFRRNVVQQTVVRNFSSSPTFPHSSVRTVVVILAVVLPAVPIARVRRVGQEVLHFFDERRGRHSFLRRVTLFKSTVVACQILRHLLRFSVLLSLRSSQTEIVSVSGERRGHEGRGCGRRLPPTSVVGEDSARVASQHCCDRNLRLFLYQKMPFGKRQHSLTDSPLSFLSCSRGLLPLSPLSHSSLTLLGNRHIALEKSRGRFAARKPVL